MTGQQIVLTKEEGSPQHPPKFSIGDEVIWAYVKASGRFFGEASGCKVAPSQSNFPAKP
jgi:hypothetical protein